MAVAVLAVVNILALSNVGAERCHWYGREC